MQEQIREREKMERPGTSWKTIFTVTFVFLLVGPFRQIVFKLVKQLLAGGAETAGEAAADGDDGFEF